MKEANVMRRSKRCEWIDWHKPGSTGVFSMASAAGYAPNCIRCGRKLLMDSLGGWFGYGASNYPEIAVLEQGRVG